jgi:hypothetical protein
MEAMDEAIAVRGGPSLTTDRAADPTRAVAAAVVAWAAVAVPLLAVVLDADRGVDAMDESHYLLAAQPWASTSAFDGVFGWYLGILLRILGDDVARLRVVAALVLVLASLPAARATRRAAETATGDAWPSWLRAVWPAGVAAGSLCFYVVFVRTPAYNWFAEVGLLLVAAGLAGLVVPASAELRRADVAAVAVPLGVGLAVTAIGKTPSALGALVVVAVSAGVVARLGRTPPRWVRTVGAATGAVLLVALALHLLLVNGLVTTLTALRRAAGALAIVDPGHYTPSGLLEGAVHGGWDVLAGSPGPLMLWAALPLLALLATGRPEAERRRWLIALALPGLVLPVLLVVHGFPGGVAGLASAAGPPVLAAETGFAVAIVALSWRLGERPPGAPGATRPAAPVSLLVLGAGLACLGLSVPLGTSVQYATQTPAAAGLFACAAGVLLAAAPPGVRVPALTALVGAVVVLAAVAVPTSRARAPYRLQPLDQQVLPRSVVPGAPPLLVDVATAGWIDDLRADAAAAGWRPGTPMLDLTWHPMSVLVLDGRAPATLLPAFPGWGSEAASAGYALRQQDPGWGRRAWILVPGQQAYATTDAAVRSVGRAFPGDYVHVGRVTAPYDGQQQDLWRPRNSPLIGRALRQP